MGIKYQITELPITHEDKSYDSPYHRVERKVHVNGPSAFHVVVRRVNVTSSAFPSVTSGVVRFSESQYAIPNSDYIRLHTTAYYRDWEDGDRCGIGDSEEATLRRNMDLATFQREAGQTPLPGAQHVQTSLTYRKECWVLCASTAPKSLTQMNSMRASVSRGYDATTLIADQSQFAKQLGIEFGKVFQTSAIKGPGKVWWMLLPQVVVDHGPVEYTETPSDVIERLPSELWGLVMPFAKRGVFSDQNEYRFVVSVGGSGEPEERTLDLEVTEELRGLTRLVG